MQIDKIKKQLVKIQTLLEKLEENNLSQIDKDIILQKLRKIYEQVLKMELVSNDSSSNKEKGEISVDNTIKENDDAIIEVEIEKPLEVAPTESLQEESSEKTSKDPDQVVAIKKDKSDFTKDTTDSQEVTMDLFAPHDPTSSSQKPAENKKSVEDKIRMNKIFDLKKAIGINEKFQFINELFSGDLKEYTIAINQLNEKNTLEEALTVLNTFAEQNEWNKESEAFELLHNLTERRYL